MIATFIRNTIRLLDEGATIPSFARYHKEMTGSLDEVVITRIRDRVNQLKEMDSRRQTIIHSITEQEKMTPELEKAHYDAATLFELEEFTCHTSPKERPAPVLQERKALKDLPN